MTGTWQQINVAGKTADVYEPPAPPRFGLLFLHDAEGETLADQPVFTRLLMELRLSCVCPHGDQSWWADRLCLEFDPQMTAERYLIERIVPVFQERWRQAARMIGLLGIGMGGQGALRLAFKHAELFPVVAAIAPSIDYHELYGQGTPLDEMYNSKEQCRQDTAPLHVPPHNYPPHIFLCSDPEDEWYRGSDRLHEKLNALGIPHTHDLITEASGHSWEYFNRMADRALRFVHTGLDYESRRLL